MGEFQLLLETVERLKDFPDVLADESIGHLDRIADARSMVYALRENFHRAMRAKADVATALADVRKHEQILSYANRDWKKAASELANLLRDLDTQLEAQPIERPLDDAIAAVDELFERGHALTAAGALPLHIEHDEALSVANEGYPSWLSSLPDDDWSGAVDAHQETPLRWVEGEGWVTR